MNKWIPFVEQKTRSGRSTRWGDAVITPEARALVIRLPFAGFVWNRPAAVVIEQDGRLERIPIHDPTRKGVLLLAAAGGLASLGLFWVRMGLRGGDRS